MRLDYLSLFKIISQKNHCASFMSIKLVFVIYADKRSIWFSVF